MSNLTKTHKFGFLSLFVAAILVGSIVSISSGINDQAFATKKKSNEAEQAIGQSTSTSQSADCFSLLGDNLASCNNIALSFNLNDGNNAAGQQ